MLSFYEKNSKALYKQYQSLAFEVVHSQWLPFLPSKPGRALDVGAGSGRDALWLASEGWTVVAVEPCEVLSQQCPPSNHVTWFNDRLPSLDKINQASYQRYDLILVSAVWMHLNHQEQISALARLKGFLDNEGLLVITWRNQACEVERQFYPVDTSIFNEAEILSSDDAGQRKEVHWHCAIIRG
jgi:2-polyprenyl-3-methyl-5-hydroxy-6-metoxy-1,4-benzoquinol methylase